MLLVPLAGARSHRCFPGLDHPPTGVPPGLDHPGLDHTGAYLPWVIEPRGVQNGSPTGI